MERSCSPGTRSASSPTTDIDQDTLYGDGVEVPIDEIVALEKRKISPARTGLAVFGGLALLPYVFWGIVIVGGSMLGF